MQRRWRTKTDVSGHRELRFDDQNLPSRVESVRVALTAALSLLSEIAAYAEELNVIRVNTDTGRAPVRDNHTGRTYLAKGTDFQVRAVLTAKPAELLLFSALLYCGEARRLSIAVLNSTYGLAPTSFFVTLIVPSLLTVPRRKVGVPVAPELFASVMSLRMSAT
jgi:hypothetical protein